MALLEDLLHRIRIADVFDIIFIAIFLYALLTWFKATASRSVLMGVSVLTIVFFLARAFDMYMTAMVFQAVFAVLLVALVVVFQEDLRRVFERLATWGTLRDRRVPDSAFPHLDIIVEAVADLAGRKVGALIVLRGREVLERHLDGGVPLGGQLSRALLESIFDPHSMGHDGAVIIENDRIQMFGTHLPLSRNLKEVGSRGTRHSAALGLSECSDALVIVVSEQTGDISVAQGGKLIRVATTTELRDRLDRFCRYVFPQPTKSLTSSLLRENAALKGISILLACVAWLLLIYEAESVQRTFVIPIEYRKVPEGLEFVTPRPTEARVTLTGYERDFRLLEPSTLKVSLDLESIQPGVTNIPIEDQDVRRSTQLEIYRIEPSVVRLYVKAAGADKGNSSK